MDRTHAKRRAARGGFTLIEVLLVIAIIALLAAFVVPSFINVQSGAEIDLTRSLVSSGGPVAGALELYRINVGRYPEELRELVERPQDDDLAARWRGPYITNLDDLRDAWGRDLNYRYPGEVNQDRYDLWSNGPDGQEGTDDDIGNWSREQRRR